MAVGVRVIPTYPRRHEEDPFFLGVERPCVAVGIIIGFAITEPGFFPLTITRGSPGRLVCRVGGEGGCMDFVFTLRLDKHRPQTAYSEMRALMGSAVFEEYQRVQERGQQEP